MYEFFQRTAKNRAQKMEAENIFMLVMQIGLL